ncbi:MAG: hypothetical protein KDG89_18080 [Geminicoccaceae bacterium]|nr:hypothetical protein [Geminicoccaceae bacterium]
MPPGVGDGRARFREIWQAVAAARPNLPDARPAAAALRRFAGEGAGEGRPVALGPPLVPERVLVVGGIYGACVAWLVRPFSDALRHLARLGWRVGEIPIEPRSSSARNARLIQDHLQGLGLDPDERVVLVGYSKGLCDIMEATALPGGLPPGVRAVVGIGGSAWGSPVAADLPRPLKALLDRLALPGCPPGDGGGIDSLLPERRRAWLAGHPLPAAIGWFSLVAVPTPPRLSRVLVPSHRRLARIDPLNDGQMIASDAMIPASTLLGVLDADHWALALPIARNESLAASAIAAGLVDENAFPREVMLESVLRYVGEALG